jgi:hypothetical protein
MKDEPAVRSDERPSVFAGEKLQPALGVRSVELDRGWCMRQCGHPETRLPVVRKSEAKPTCEIDKNERGQRDGDPAQLGTS